MTQQHNNKKQSNTTQHNKKKTRQDNTKQNHIETNKISSKPNCPKRSKVLVGVFLTQTPVSSFMYLYGRFLRLNNVILRKLVFFSEKTKMFKSELQNQEPIFWAMLKIEYMLNSITNPIFLIIFNLLYVKNNTISTIL